MDNNFKPKIEKPVSQNIFNYDEAATIARKRLELSETDDKLGKAEAKRQKKDFCSKYSDYEAASKIFELEEKKQLILLQRKKLLSGLESSNSLKILGAEYEAVYSSQKGGFTINNKFISEEEIFTDVNWGKIYNLSASTPLELKQQYLDEVFEHQYNELYNRQLVIDRVKIEDHLDEKMESTYDRVEKAFDNKEEEKSAGLLFEKMLYNLVYKFSHHFQKYGIKIERMTVIDDVENKIDFVVSLPNKLRGVGIEKENSGKTAIQFTIVEKYTEKYNTKVRQVKRVKEKVISEKNVDDLVLISVPVDCKEIINTFNNWGNNGRPAGGPENNLSADIKIKAIKGIMEKTELADNTEFINDLKQFFSK